MQTHDVECFPEHNEDFVQPSVVDGRRYDQGHPLLSNMLVRALAAWWSACTTTEARAQAAW
jgi:hypothetical protein